MSSYATQMGTAPISKLFVSMSIPVTLSLLVGGFYTVVDALFIARGVSADALGGISMVFPVQMMIIAVGSMIGNGLASVITRQLGAKKLVSAQHATGSSIVLSILIGLTLTGLILLTIEPLLDALGVTDTLRPYAKDYLIVTSYGTAINLVLSCLNSLVRAEGKMGQLMFSISLGAVINIILDPIAIYLLKLGVVGVALATIAAQTITLLYMLWLFLSGRTLLKIDLKTLRLQGSYAKQIISIGLPTFFTQIGVSVVISVVNGLLGHSGFDQADTMISAYGIAARLFIFLFFPTLGMVIAFQTLCSYNYGAQQYRRVREITTLSVKVTTIYCAITSMMTIIFAEQIVGLFTKEAQLIHEGVTIMRFIFSGFIVVGASSIWAAYFQAIGQAKPAMFLSTFRIYLIHIPLLFIISLFFDMKAIWYTYPISNYVSFFVAIFFIRKAYQKLRYQSHLT